MSTTLATDEPEGLGPDPDRGTAWRKVLMWALLAIPILFIALMAIFMFFEPFLLIFIVVFGLGAFLVSRGGRGGAIFALVIAILFLAMNGPVFLIPALAQPASIGDFLPAVVALLACIIAIVAAVAILRGREGESSTSRTVLRVAGAIFLLSVVGAVIARATYENAQPQEGDIRIVTDDTSFSTDTVEAESGTVAVFVDNKDSTFHTFTVDELDVSLQIPAGSKARVEFDAPAGEYKFYCIPHEADMKGTLTVR